MSNLPPPVPPAPNGAPVPPVPPTSGGGFPGFPDGWDWDRARELAEQWYRPLLELEGWKALGYLFVGMLSSYAFFAALVALGAVAFGLLFVFGLGLLLVGPTFKVVEAFAAAERAMAGWVGVDIAARPVQPLGRFGLRGLRDPERWRQVGFIAVNVVLGTFLFGFGSFAHGLVVRVVFGDGLLTPSIINLMPLGVLLSLVIAAIALGAAPRLAVFFAQIKARITAWFLGPDRLATAEERVTELSTQRQEILDAVASERRRIERNLHDGVQQQLVAIGLDLGMAEQQLARDPERARELIVNARQKVQGSIGELRQLGRGLHPAILEDRGIDAALSAIVSGAPIPISIHVDPDIGLDTDVAETVYFIANEAIANVLKHARARVASVHVARVAANVRVTVHDDGVGGADPSRGTGLAGIRARVHAVDGTLAVSSPAGGPTTIVAELPRARAREGGPS